MFSRLLLSLPFLSIYIRKCFKQKSYLFGFESQFDEDLLQFLVDKVDAELYNAIRQSTHRYSFKLSFQFHLPVRIRFFQRFQSHKCPKCRCCILESSLPWQCLLSKIGKKNRNEPKVTLLFRLITSPIQERASFFLSLFLQTSKLAVVNGDYLDEEIKHSTIQSLG